MENELRNLIANVGFPIAVSIFLLIRIETKVSTLSDSINGCRISYSSVNFPFNKNRNEGKYII